MSRQKQALRRAMKARRAAVRERLRAAREAARNTPQARRRRARRRLLFLMLLLLLLLLIRCDCETPPPPAGMAADAAQSTQVVDAGVKPDAAPQAVPEPPRKKLSKLDEIERPAMQVPNAAPPKWLNDLRLQVAARAPRLARCVEGAAQRGAIRWSAAIDPARGTVADQAIEPIGDAPALTPQRRRCLLGVLASPSYRLGGAEGLPPRITLVVEL